MADPSVRLHLVFEEDGFDVHRWKLVCADLSCGQPAAIPQEWLEIFDEEARVQRLRLDYQETQPSGAEVPRMLEGREAAPESGP